MTFLITLYILLFAFITWRHIHLGIYLFFLLLPTYLIRFDIFSIPTTLLEAMFGIIFIVWLLRHRPRLADLISLIKKYKWLFIGSGLFLLSATISIFTSLDTRAALGEWKAFYIEPFILCIILLTTVKTRETFNKILCMLILCGLATSLLSIFQSFTGWMVPWAFWENRDTFRVTGWYGFPNGVGLFLAPLAPLAIYLIKTFYKNNKIIFITSLLFLLTTPLAVFFAKSTAGLIGIAAGIGLLLLIYKKTRWPAVIIGIIAVITLMGIPSIREELLFQDRSGQIRLSIYSETIEFLKDNPLLAAGLASYADKIAPYHTPVNGEGIEIFHHPHNLFLTMWVNTGLIGLVGFVLLLVSIFVIATTKKSSPFVVASLLTLLITGLVDSPYIKNDLAMLFWGILALIIISSYDKNLENKKA